MFYVEMGDEHVNSVAVKIPNIVSVEEHDGACKLSLSNGHEVVVGSSFEEMLSMLDQMGLPAVSKEKKPAIELAPPPKIIT